MTPIEFVAKTERMLHTYDGFEVGQVLANDAAGILTLRDEATKILNDAEQKHLPFDVRAARRAAAAGNNPVQIDTCACEHKSCKCMRTVQHKGDVCAECRDDEHQATSDFTELSPD